MRWAASGGAWWAWPSPGCRTRFKAWVADNPSRWAIVFATLFVIASGVSTLLSVEPSVSLWGRNPGRDGYGLYNLATYYLLFIFIATHLKTRGQLWRLLGVIVASATLAASYGAIQHYGLDPLGDGPAARAKSSFGNPNFAASYLVMALPISLGLATSSWPESTSL